MNILDLKKQSFSELQAVAKKMRVNISSSIRRQDLIFTILQAHTEHN